MRVTLERHGGQAAGIRRPPQAVETDALAPGAAAELAGLVAAAKAAPAPGGAGPPRRAPDAMAYTVTVEGNGAPVVLRQSDAGMSDAFAALLEWMETRANAG